MRLGCYASETDIYWTKDNKIVVAHANSECKINGLYPWEHTLTEIQAAGRLTNGEIVPSLEDYIRAVMVKGSKTKICLDIKAITKPTTHHAESVKACQRACEIIAAMEAQHFCEFICTGYEDVVKHCAKYANAVGVDIGAMGNHSASTLKNWGYTWHNRDKGYGVSADKINSFINSGMEISVFTIDSDSDWNTIQSYHKQLRGITTNYPGRIMAKTRLN
jgi:glycerophosphoryl diester phosphodiesterase